MRKSVLILAAMKEEEQALLSELKRFQPTRTLWDAKLGLETTLVETQNYTIRIAQSGIGPVNAALALYSIAQREPLSAVYLLGVGGALTPGLRIGDLVIATHVVQHDSFCSLDRGELRMRSGDLVLTQWQNSDLRIACDPALAQTLRSVKVEGHVKEGVLLSGNEFVGTPERKKQIAQIDREALLVDMEGCGIALTAHKLGLPFIVAKTVADRLHPDGTIENDFVSCLKSAAKNAAQLMHCILDDAA